MTIQEIITNVSELKPNQYGYEVMISWISEVDGKVYSDIIVNFLTKEEKEEATEWKKYDASTEPTLQLLIPDAYANAYIDYVCAKIDFYNGEYARYNNNMAAFNENFRAFSDWYYRNHKNTNVSKFRL